MVSHSATPLVRAPAQAQARPFHQPNRLARQPRWRETLGIKRGIKPRVTLRISQRIILRINLRITPGKILWAQSPHEGIDKEMFYSLRKAFDLHRQIAEPLNRTPSEP
jgi:hypothetical protein